MQLNVLRELRQPLGAITTYDIQECSSGLAALGIRDLTGTLTFLRTDEGLLTSFAGITTIRESCARCLKEVDCPLEVAFEEEYVPLVDAASGEKFHIVESDDRFTIGADFLLDLREGLRQYVLMAEPIKPLCRSDCAGLCRSCGADLNDARCLCSSGLDERWGALSGLTLSDNEGS